MMFAKPRFLLVLASLLTCCRPSVEPEKFSRDNWRDASQLSRYGMAGDYLRTRDVTTMTLEEVVADLGQPDDVDNYWEYALSANGLLSRESHMLKESWEHPALFAHFDMDHKLRRFSASLRNEPTGIRAFDSAAWATCTPADRESMVGDLLDGKALVGFSKADVELALGRPDRENADFLVEYTVAVHFLDHQHLAFSVDQGGRVTGAILYDG